jgi:hypothetical protein
MQPGPPDSPRWSAPMADGLAIAGRMADSLGPVSRIANDLGLVAAGG